ncbi:hypothetical protein [Streptomyces mirabilis]|uniref:hypothetical protein n=1 Tax=Streptomyces mirabilis TaxID=68239 RepID=UPI003675CD92
MKRMGQGVAALLCAAMAGMAAGCSSGKLAIPDKFCRVPVEKSSLSSVIPDGDRLKQTYEDLESRPGASCNMSVDGHSVLAVNLLRWDRAPDPVDWDKVGSPYKHAARREVSFPGYASIGSSHAIVQATCNTRTAYMSFVVDFSGDRVENTSTGYKKLQRFIDDFVPQETKKFDCTK